MRKIISCCILFVFLTVSTVAIAQDGIRREKILAIYQDFKIIFNGRLVTTLVEPFQMENGYIMVPLREMAEAFGYEIEWDPSTKAVYIANGTDIIKKTNLNLKYIEELPVLRNVGPFFNLKSRQVTIASRQFKHGLILELPIQDKPTSAEENLKKGTPEIGETVVDLKGQYQWLEGYLGVDDETRNSNSVYVLTILGDGIPLYETKNIMPSEYPFKINVNVHNVKRLTIQARLIGDVVGYDDKLWVALADWFVY